MTHTLTLRVSELICMTSILKISNKLRLFPIGVGVGLIVTQTHKYLFSRQSMFAFLSTRLPLEISTDIVPSHKLLIRWLDNHGQMIEDCLCAPYDKRLRRKKNKNIQKKSDLNLHTRLLCKNGALDFWISIFILSFS